MSSYSQFGDITIFNFMPRNAKCLEKYKMMVHFFLQNKNAIRYI